MDKKDLAETVVGTFEITVWMEGVKGCLVTKEMGLLLSCLREAETEKFSKLSTIIVMDWPNLPLMSNWRMGYSLFKANKTAVSFFQYLGSK